MLSGCKMALQRSFVLRKELRRRRLQHKEPQHRHLPRSYEQRSYVRRRLKERMHPFWLFWLSLVWRRICVPNMRMLHSNQHRRRQELTPLQGRRKWQEVRLVC
jgi:hypothetical protein